jgi:hypothetical protein
MFEVLKPIIEKNKILDKAIGNLCSNITKEVREIEQVEVNQYIQDRLDNILNLIDCLESNHNYHLNYELADLKESFHVLDTAIIVHRNYRVGTDRVIKESIDEFFKWSN